MINRLLLTTAVGLALGTAAFAQTAADPAKIEPSQSSAQTDKTRPLSRLEKWQADRQAERDAVKASTQMPASAGPKIQGQALAGGASTPNTQTSTARPLVTLSTGVDVTESDRTRITDAVARMTVKPLRGVDFSVTVGSLVPRELRLYSLPAEVVEIVPQYRDNRFMVVDKEIVIVEPSSQKIIAIMPRDAAVTATAATPAAAAPVAVTTVTATTVTATPVTATSASAPSAASTPTMVQAPTSSPTAATASKAKELAAMNRAERRTARRAARDDWRRAHARAHAEVRVGQRVPDSVVLHDLPQSYRGAARASRAIVQID
jgi:hypothetical protein